MSERQRPTSSPCVLDGVFSAIADGDALEFYPTPPPSDAEVARLLSRIRARILRLLARRGLAPDVDVTPPDPVAEESPALAGLSSASVQGRVALGERAGARLLALGRDPEARWATCGGARHAHLDGFDLHANVAVRGEDRKGLEQLCRYLLRPAVAQDRLRLTGEGRVVLELKAAWGDGTTHLVFEPVDFLARLAALTPRPRINLVFYHGVLAPHARARAAVVRYGVAASTAAGPITEAGSVGTDTRASGGGTSSPTGRGWRWADLMRRAFDWDVLACPRCGGRLRLIALIFDPGTIEALQRSLVPSESADRAPPARVLVSGLRRLRVTFCSRSGDDRGCSRLLGVAASRRSGNPRTSNLPFPLAPPSDALQKRTRRMPRAWLAVRGGCPRGRWFVRAVSGGEGRGTTGGRRPSFR